MRQSLQLSIVIPCYNDNLAISLAPLKIEKYLKQYRSIIGELQYEIVIVDDGSTDASYETIVQLYGSDEKVRIVHYDKNRGKGYAIRKGIVSSRYDNICFMDADLSTDLSALSKLILWLKTNLLPKQYIVIGSRRAKGSAMGQKPKFIRNIMSHVCVKYVNRCLGINVTDSQCGFKAFDKQTARTLARNQCIFGWAFDSEYILIAGLVGITVKELPVTWNEPDYKRRASTVRPFRDTLRFMRDIHKIRRLHGKMW